MKIASSQHQKVTINPGGNGPITVVFKDGVADVPDEVGVTLLAVSRGGDYLRLKDKRTFPCGLEVEDFELPDDCPLDGEECSKAKGRARRQAESDLAAGITPAPKKPTAKDKDKDAPPPAPPAPVVEPPLVVEPVVVVEPPVAPAPPAGSDSK